MASLGTRLERWGDLLGLPAGVANVLAGALAALVLGSIVRLGYHALRPGEATPARLRSLATWWVIALVCVGAVLIGRLGVVVLMAGVSALALREFSRLARPDVGPFAIGLAYATVPLQYGCIALGRLALAQIVTPTLASIALLVALLARGRTGAYSAEAGKLVLGTLLSVYLLSFAAMTPPAVAVTAEAGSGWFVLLVLLVVTGDIVQALVGRPLGRHRILPSVSPGKTWEGWLGGLVATTLLAAAIGPALTPLSVAAAAGGGALVSASGVLGDLNVSALKRERGVADSGALLAGQGGMLDRIDALTFAAPLLYLYALAWL